MATNVLLVLLLVRRKALSFQSINQSTRSTQRAQTSAERQHNRIAE